MRCAVGPGGGVAAFEPNPAVAAQLRARLQALDLDEVQVYELALSDQQGRAQFVVALDRPQESGLRARSVYNGGTRTQEVEVHVARLDALGLPAPAFIKLDTEGAEYKVLQGARRTLAQVRPVVAFEFGESSYAAYGVEPGEVFDFFEAMGYALLGIRGDRLDRPAFIAASRRQDYWDYVACDAAQAARVEALLRAFPSRA